MYVVEKILYAYFYRQPPMFDNNLNSRVIGILSQAPIMLILNGYWLLSNKQMFSDHQVHSEFKGDITDPQHRLFDYSEGVDGSLMLLVFLPFFVFDRFFDSLLLKITSFCRRRLGKAKPYHALINDKFVIRDDVEVDENLPNYFEVL